MGEGVDGDAGNHCEAVPDGCFGSSVKSRQGYLVTAPIVHKNKKIILVPCLSNSQSPARYLGSDKRLNV